MTAARIVVPLALLALLAIERDAQKRDALTGAGLER